MSAAGAEIGIISDTHGLLRPAAVAALQGVSLILHAGDIGGKEVLAGLQQVAPVVAVRGNMDWGAWAASLPAATTVDSNGCRFHLLHDLGRLDLDPAAAGLAAVVFGHSHQPALRRQGGVWFLNPGSAGPRRFRLPVTLIRLEIVRGLLKPRLLELNQEA